MSERDSKGRFLPGNTLGRPVHPIEWRLRREDRKFIIGMIRRFSFMKLQDLQEYSKNNKDIIVIEALFLRHYADAIKDGSLNFLKLILNYLGIVEMKALAIQEIDKIENEQDDEIKELNLSREEKIMMLDKYRAIIDEETNG